MWPRRMGGIEPAGAGGFTPPSPIGLEPMADSLGDPPWDICAKAKRAREGKAFRLYFAIFSSRTNMLPQARSIRSGDIW